MHQETIFMMIDGGFNKESHLLLQILSRHANWPYFLELRMFSMKQFFIYQIFHFTYLVKETLDQSGKLLQKAS